MQQISARVPRRFAIRSVFGRPRFLGKADQPIEMTCLSSAATARPKQRHNSEVGDGNSGITAIISDVFPQCRGAGQSARHYSPETARFQRGRAAIRIAGCAFVPQLIWIVKRKIAIFVAHRSTAALPSISVASAEPWVSAYAGTTRKSQPATMAACPHRHPSPPGPCRRWCRGG